jgi:hypothetical protein
LKYGSKELNWQCEWIKIKNQIYYKSFLLKTVKT